MYSGFFKSGTIFDYISDDFLIINFEKDLALSRLRQYEERLESLRKNKEERGEIPYFFPISRIDVKNLKNKLENYNSLNLSERDKLETIDKFNQKLFSRLNINLYGIGEIIKYIEKNNEENKYIFFTSHKDRLTELLSEKKLNLYDKNQSKLIDVPYLRGIYSNIFNNLDNNKKLIFFSDLETLGIKTKNQIQKNRLRNQQKLVN